jgi:hypothetical protein
MYKMADERLSKAEALQASNNVQICHYCVITVNMPPDTIVQQNIPVLLARWFLARMIFDTKDGGDTFLRNVGSPTDYTTLYLRRWKYSGLISVFLYP